MDSTTPYPRGPAVNGLIHRNHSTKSDDQSNGAHVGHEEHKHDHDHDHEHDHSHSHSIFSAHTHSREDANGHAHGTLVEAIQKTGDRGSQITILGLVMNIGLTGAKGAAGWFMNSAALLAEAGHSASDLLGDFITLFSWRYSRRPPSERYPYGFGKFEVLGTTTVSLLLIGGALGIGFHSYNLLMHHLLETIPTLTPGTAQTILQNVTETAQSMTGVTSTLGHSHGHHHVLDPNAAWFAAAGVILKEWLYRVTKKVADEERSSVLKANAIHHRSDAYSSLVALIAILGTWWFPTLPLDPLGGFIVALVILRQGIGLFAGAFNELTDAGVSQRTHTRLLRSLDPLLASSHSPEAESTLHAITNLRAMRSGAVMFVDVNARVPSSIPISDATSLEARIRAKLIEARRDVYEVRVKFDPVDPDTRDDSAL